MSATNRGKYAEAEVKKALKKLESSNCTHARWPDAHSGSFVTAPADFLVLQAGLLRLIEVKQVQHSFRLPYGNFQIDQIARMRNWEAAGAKAWVLVCFMPTKEWRLAPLEYFFARPLLTDKGRALGSWDMRDVPVRKLADAIVST